MSTDDYFRREFLGRPVRPKLEDTHPFPWTVKKSIVGRTSREFITPVWVVLDARSQCVAECESPYVAEEIASLPVLRDSYQQQKKIRKLFNALGQSHLTAEEVKKINDQFTACVAGNGTFVGIDPAVPGSDRIVATLYPPDAPPEAVGAALVATGYKQTSRKFRTVARLPEGETGLEALKRTSPKEYQRIMDNAERQAASSYRGGAAKREGNELKLTVDQFVAFRAAGGVPS